jgi:hypothetical protein
MLLESLESTIVASNVPLDLVLVAVANCHLESVHCGHIDLMQLGLVRQDLEVFVFLFMSSWLT